MNNNIDINKIKCMECNDLFYKITERHLKKCSGLTTKQYKEKYIDVLLVSDYYRNNMKIAAKKAFKNGNRIPPMQGKNHKLESKQKMSENSKGIKKEKFTDEHCKNLRISTIKRIEDRDGIIFPNFSLKACEIFDWFNKEFGLNGCHALNGGEFYISKLGYWVDYYEPNLNLVIEYDEKRHYNSEGKLREKDIQRQKQIENFLGCKFIRIKNN